jgi:DsbC/DsbD-like thiol-disulfide interchange protein
MHRALPHRMISLAIPLMCMLASQRVWAQDASPWEATLHSAARLVAGEAQNSEDGVWLRAGIEIRLDPGWHTYWRYPGDSGVPPTFDFSASENVNSVAVLWPAPQRFPDGAGGGSIGYIGHVTFPLHVTAADPAKISLLHLKLGYAICSNLCVPAEADLKLARSGNAGAEEPTLVAAEARVPRRVTLGKGGGLSIRSVHREEDQGHERIVVEIAAAERTPVDLFAEGPTPGWALPLLEPIDAAPDDSSGLRRFTFDLNDLPAGATTNGSTLTLTAVSSDDAIEVSAPLN